MAKFIDILGWIFGIFFLVAALAALFRSHLVSFLGGLIIGLMLLPSGPNFVGDMINAKISNQARWIIIAVAVVVCSVSFYTIGLFIPIFR